MDEVKMEQVNILAPFYYKRFEMESFEPFSNVLLYFLRPASSTANT